MITFILLIALGHPSSSATTVGPLNAFGVGAAPAGGYARFVETALRSNRSDERSDAEATVANYRAWALGSLSTQSHWFFASLEIERHLMEVFTDSPNWATKLAEADPRVRDDILRTFFDKILDLSRRTPEASFAWVTREASVWLLGIYLPSQEARLCETLVAG